MPRYGRILLKLSGEVLAGEASFGIDPERVKALAAEVAEVAQSGVQIGLVVGGGNFFRGVAAAAQKMDRVTADHMGMLATVINALALQDALEKAGAPTRVMTAIRMDSVAEPYIRRRAIRHLEKGRLVIFAAGTSNPYFSTDTAATLRGLEIHAEVVAKATRVDGVYDKDPLKHSDAVRFPEIGYSDVLSRNLRVLDASAVAMCRDNHMPIVVFNLNVRGNIMRMAMGEPIGTLIHLNLMPEQLPPPRGTTSRTSRTWNSAPRRAWTKSIADMQHTIAGIRTGRASVSVFDNIRVDYYGSPTPINQVANLHVPEPTLITITPWDVSQIGAIEKAIRVSDLGLNPANDGKMIRVPIPPLTEERRKEIVKRLHHVAEEHRVALRNVRRDANEHLKKLLKDKAISEDEERRALEETQKMTDVYISKVDAVSKTKEKEILELK